MSVGSRLQSITPLEDPFSQFKDYLKLEVETLLTFSPSEVYQLRCWNKPSPHALGVENSLNLGNRENTPPMPQGIDPPSSGGNSEEFTQPP